MASRFSAVTETGRQKPMTKEELLHQVKEELAGSGDHTIRQLVSVIARFYDFSQGNFTRGEVVKYIKDLDRRGYAAGTRVWHYRILKRGFEIAHKLNPEIEWSFGKRAPSELPVDVAEWDIKALPIPVEELKIMIDGAKDNKLPAEWGALIAASSIYGLRRIELVELMPEFLDLNNGILRVITAKHGRSREHLIPEGIKPYLSHYPFGKYSDFKLSRLYHEIREAVGLPVVYGSGFHSVRRLLDTQLLYIFPYPVVRTFLRWKKSRTDMVMHYWTPPSDRAVENIVFGVEPFPTYSGEMVYGRHPFLEFWR